MVKLLAFSSATTPSCHSFSLSLSLPNSSQPTAATMRALLALCVLLLLDSTSAHGASPPGFLGHPNAYSRCSLCSLGASRAAGGGSYR